jgi:hypothetical protein
MPPRTIFFSFFLFSVKLGPIFKVPYNNNFLCWYYYLLYQNKNPWIISTSGDNSVIPWPSDPFTTTRFSWVWVQHWLSWVEFSIKKWVLCPWGLIGIWWGSDYKKKTSSYFSRWIPWSVHKPSWVGWPLGMVHKRNGDVPLRQCKYVVHESFFGNLRRNRRDMVNMMGIEDVYSLSSKPLSGTEKSFFCFLSVRIHSFCFLSVHRLVV